MDSLLETILSHPFTAAGAVLLTWFLASTVLAYRRLSHIPGPFLASISDLWLIRASTSRRLSAVFEETARKYGPLVRISPNQILTSDADLLRRCGAVRGTYERASWYRGFRFADTDNMFTLRGLEAHDRRKAQIGVAYNISGREVDLIEPNVDSQVLEMVALLRRKYCASSPASDGTGKGGRRGQLLEFSHLTTYLTLDIITRAAFGQAFGHLQTESDVTGWLEQLRSTWPMIALVNEWPLLRSMLYSDTFFTLFGHRPTDKTGAGMVWGVVADSVHKRFKGRSQGPNEARTDMLGSWIQHGLNEKECVSEGLLGLAAGSETTATVMRITLLCLLSNPPVYSKLKAVVSKAVAKGSVSEPISYAEAREIPYLQAVVLEGMRMRPGTTGTFPKVVPPQGETVRGIFIPGGTLISNNVPALLRDANVFGSDAALFRPERWLEADGAQRTEMQSTVELMFGGGRWMCAGKPIAYMELHKTFFELFRHFDLSLVNPTKPWQSICYNVFLDDDFWVRVTEKAEG